MPHWKHNATRCAMPLCERTRRKGWTTCALFGHAERGISLYGLAQDAPRLTAILDASHARVPDIGERVMNYVDYDIGTVVDRVGHSVGHYDIHVRWDSDPSWPSKHSPDELLVPPATTVDADSPAL